MYPRKIEVI